MSSGFLSRVGNPILYSNRTEALAHFQELFKLPDSWESFFQVQVPHLWCETIRNKDPLSIITSYTGNTLSSTLWRLKKEHLLSISVGAAQYFKINECCALWGQKNEASNFLLVEHIFKRAHRTEHPFINTSEGPVKSSQQVRQDQQKEKAQPIYFCKQSKTVKEQNQTNTQQKTIPSPCPKEAYY